MAEGVKYQWKVAGEWWKETCRIAKEAGVKKIAIEEFPGALVHNVRTFNQLCEAVGEDSDVLGLNLDPSHLMIQGAEPIEAAWALGEKIFYVHGKGGVTFNGIIAANDQMALGAMEALKGANIPLGTGEGQVMISGIDGTAEALQAVKNDQMAQTVLQDAPGQGAAAVEVIKTYMAGEKPDAEVLVLYVSVTAENVDEYLSK